MNRDLLLILCLFFVSTSFIDAQVEMTAEEIGISSLRTTLADAGKSRTATVRIQLPDEQGRMQTYKAWESSFLSPQLARKRPDYHSYIIVDVNNPLNRGRIAISDYGIDAYILTEKGPLGIHAKDGIGSRTYEIYLGARDLEELREHTFCDGIDIDEDQKKNKEEGEQSYGRAFNLSNGSNFRTYDLAIVTTGEFHDANGGSVAAAETVVMNTVNAIEVIYENEFAVRFDLLSPKIYTDHDTDPFTPGGGSRPSQAADAVDMNFSQSAYDIGHVFHDSNEPPAELGGGGVATLNAVCDNGSSSGGGYVKARGWSSSFDNTINSWYQLASHEFGHMFDALHTFNGDGGSCTTGNHSSTTAYEIGSGTTIMSYNGLCGSGQNIPSSGVLDNYFHVNSLEEMINYMNGGGSCSADTSSGNTPPTVNADTCGGTHTIPISTPFELRGYATDPDGDMLTYCWEQYDEDGPGDPTHGYIADTAAGDSLAPLFRSYPPTTDPVRTFPSQDLLLANDYLSSFEPLSTVARTMHFRLTVRDNHPGAGGIAINDITVNVDSDGPFEVTAPNGGETWSAGSTQTVTWAVNNTSSFCGNVNVLLSVDGGATYPYMLAENVSNDGSEMITIPDGVADTDEARMRVECADDDCVVFFDISNNDFEVTSNCIVEASHVCPDTAHTYNEGDPGLNLDLNGVIGDVIVETTLSTTSAGPTYDVVLDDGSGSCLNSGFTGVYDTVEFIVTTSGVYTITIDSFGGGSDFRIGNLFENSFDPNAPCSTWLASNTTDLDGSPGGGVTGSSSFSDTLDNCKTYFLSLSRYGGSTSFDNIVSFTGPGDVIEVSDLPSGYSYTYVAADLATSAITQVDTGADFTTIPDGSYCVYGIMYKSGGMTPPPIVDPANFVGELLDTLLGSGQCLLYSSNCVSLTVNDTGGCDATFTYGPIMSMPSAPFDTAEYCQTASDPTPSVNDGGGNFSSSPAGLSINSSTGTVDLSASTAGTYTVTYTVTGGGGCSESVNFVIEAAPDAGISGDTTLCSTDNPTDLFPVLDGTPETTGSWSGPSMLDNGHLGTYDPANDNPGTYTYTVSGDICADAVADVSVTENTEPEAGTPSDLTVCETNNSVDLFTALSGEDSGGSWNDDDGTGALSGSIFDASQVNPGSYNFTYVVTTMACPDDSATVTVTVDGTNEAGTASTVNVCETNNSVNLFDGLSGEDSGGTWNDDDGTGALTDSIFDATMAGPGSYDFTYVVSGGVCPDDSVTLTVNVDDEPEAGTATAQTVCETNSSFDLFTGLSGNDSGGSWNDDDGTGALSGSMFDASAAGPGQYDFTYVVTSSDCPDDSVTLTVTVEETPDAGISDSVTVCETGSSTDLYDELGGTPDTTGSWSGPSNLDNGYLGTYDPPLDDPGTYTYTVSGTACPSSSATVEVEESLLLDAGTAVSPFIVCQTNSSVNLNEGLNGEDSGGNWNDDDNTGALSGNIFDATQVIPGAYDFTYTVSAPGCPADSTTLTVTVEEEPDAGISDSISLCADGSSTDLFSALGGTPDTGGSWSGPSGLGNGYLGTYDPTVDDPGTYTYTVEGDSCPDASAEIVVIESPVPEAGTATAQTVCETNSSFDLFTGLSGNDSGGNWNDDDGTGALSGSIFDASAAGPGTYDFTYVVSSPPCPNDSVTLTVTVEGTPSAGLGDSVNVCETGDPLNLYDKLGGSPDTAGSWNGPSMLDNGYLGTYDPTNDDPGTYTYAVSGNICPNDSAEIVLTESAALDAGTPVSPFTKCETNSSVNLNNGLTGEDGGGTWLDDDGTGALNGNIFDATQVSPGMYDFTYVVSAGGCPSDSSTLTVTVEDAPNAGIGDTLTVCSDGSPTDLFDVLGSSPEMGGSWSGPSALDNGDQGTYDPQTDDPGTYIYVVSGNICPNDSAEVEVIEETCGDTVSISGNIATNNGTSVGEVHVSWSGGASGMTNTDGSGNYSFDVGSGVDLTVSAQRDTLHGQYVSTADLIGIQLHILGLDTLNPYQIIAADATNNQIVSTVDLLQYQLVIVGLADTFQNSESWRFVPADYVFPDSLDPWDPPFPDTIPLTNVNGDTTGLDFVAVKLGDVNNVNQDNAMGGPPLLDRSNPYRFHAEVESMEAGEETVIWFEAGKTASLWGYQMSMRYDESAIRLDEVIRAPDFDGLMDANFHRPEAGRLITNYFRGLGRSIDQPERAFGWRVTAKRSIYSEEWNDLIRLEDNPLVSEAYLEKDSRNQLVLDLRSIGDKTPGFELYPNRPNPFEDGTIISFDLPKASKVDLTIMDAAGRLLQERTVDGRKGYNTLEIQGGSLPEGVLYYRVSTDEHSAVQKMILQR